ncbi:MAG: hypothetical protein ACI86P_002699 [Flavobacteriales bacterium]|jgi:hypothetical protein
MKNNIKYLTMAFALLFSFSGVAQLDNSSDVQEPNTRGISVSPAHFHLNLKPGEEKTYEITLNNDTDSPNEFQVNVFDFNMNGKGKSSFLDAGQGEYSLSEWMSISPTFVELKAGEIKKVKFTVTVPFDKTGDKAAWSIIMIEQAEPRKTIEPAKKGGETVALGVVPTFAFGIFVYQNPPNVLTENIEMTNFTSAEKDDVTYIKIEVENKGDGIAYCTAYVDLTNLDTGEQERLTVKRFTIVPSLIRDFIFALPKELKNGNYLATGVLDYENSEEIQAAKMNFKINN